MTRWFYVAILLTLLALAASFYLWNFRYDDLPEQVPIHWNIHGQPDGFVPKSDVFMTFLLLPAVMAGVLVLTLLLPWLSPKSFEVDRFRGVYGYLMMMVVALLGFIHATSALSHLKRRVAALARVRETRVLANAATRQLSCDRALACGAACIRSCRWIGCSSAGCSCFSP